MLNDALLPPDLLSQCLDSIIPQANLYVQNLPETPIKLWLMQPNWPSYRLDDEVLTRIWQQPPYWVFCWASGLAMAQYILNKPDLVKDKVVVDFGAGSGVVAIAAAMVGAKQAICCDIDDISLAACRANAELNGVVLEYLDDIFHYQSHYPKADVLFAADVLYDASNQFFLDVFLDCADDVWVADSRVKNFKHERYITHSQHTASTWPDLDEANEFRNVMFYCSDGASSKQ